jgi:hypothetical protein
MRSFVVVALVALVFAAVVQAELGSYTPHLFLICFFSLSLSLINLSII